MINGISRESGMFVYYKRKEEKICSILLLSLWDG